jgi:hypothetical protein
VRRILARYRVNGWSFTGVNNPLVFYVLVLRTVVPMGPRPSLIQAVWVDPKLGPATLYGHGTPERCDTDFVEPDPPKCDFFGENCHGFGQWWHDNKGIVTGGLVIISLVACVTGVGCVATGVVAAGVAVADRAYTFIHNEEYNGGWAAMTFFIVGLGEDALGALPGGKAGKLASEAVDGAKAASAASDAANVAKAKTFTDPTATTGREQSLPPTAPTANS